LQEASNLAKYASSNYLSWRWTENFDSSCIHKIQSCTISSCK
jgi:hypothetical protein